MSISLQLLAALLRFILGHRFSEFTLIMYYAALKAKMAKICVNANLDQAVANKNLATIKPNLRAKKEKICRCLIAFASITSR